MRNKAKRRSTSRIAIYLWNSFFILLLGLIFLGLSPEKGEIGSFLLGEDKSELLTDEVDEPDLEFSDYYLDLIDDFSFVQNNRRIFKENNDYPSVELASFIFSYNHQNLLEGVKTIYTQELVSCNLGETLFLHRFHLY